MNIQTLQIIDQVTQALIPETRDASDLRTNLRRIIQAIQGAFGSSLCAILAINPVTEEFILPLEFVGELRGAAQTIQDAPRWDGITRQVLDQELLFVEDIAEYPHLQSSFTKSEGIRAFAAVALFTRPQHKPLAVLYLDYRETRRFSDDERTLLRMLADQMTVPLQQTWLLQRYAEVTRIGQAINLEIATVEALFRKLHGMIKEILDTSHFFMLAVYRGQTKTLDYYLAERGQAGERFDHLIGQPFAGACRWVIQEQKPLLIPHRSRQADLPTELIQIPGTTTVEESLIFVPLSLRDLPLGVLTIQSLRPNAYDKEDQRVLQLLGNQVALALSNIRLFAGLSRINEAGQQLTQQFDLSRRHDSHHVIEYLTEQIGAATQADQVTIHPYQPAEGLFERAPSSDVEPERAARNDQLARFFLNRDQPLFAQQRAELIAMFDSVGITAPSENGLASMAAIPLLVGAGLVGVLIVGFHQPQHFDAPQKLLIESLASYAATVLATTLGAQQRYTRQLEILQHIDKDLARALTLPETLDSIFKLATDHIQASRAGIFLYDPVTQVLEASAFLPKERPEQQQKFSIPIADRRGLVWWAFQTKAPVRVGNVRTDPAWRDLYIPFETTTVSELDVPMIDGDEVVGVINFESTEENAFSQADQTFLEVLAGQAVLAVKNAQAYQRVDEERGALIAINAEIAGQLDRQRVFDLILERALALTNSTAGTLMLHDRQQGLLWMAAERGVSAEQKGKPHGLNEGVVGKAASKKRPVIVGDVNKPPSDVIPLQYIAGARSELAVPLLEGDVLRGVINIESTEPYHFSERDERLVMTLAGMAVIALQNAERYEHAEEGRNRLLVLADITETIISQLDDTEQVMRSILQNALKLTNAEVADLDLYENNTLITVYSTRDDEQIQRWSADAAAESANPRPKRGIMARVARTHAPYSTKGDAQRDPYFVGETDIHSEMAAPLLTEGGALFGVLNVESSRRDAFDDDDETILRLFAGQAVIAIQNAQSYAQANRARLRFQLLHKAGSKLGELSSLEQVQDAYAITLKTACSQSLSRGTIRRYDPETQVLRVVCSEDYPEGPIQDIKVGEGLNGRVAQERKTRVEHDLSELPPGSVKLPTLLGRSVVIAPIQLHDQDYYYGNLTLTHDEPDHFRDADVELFKGLATQLALTIYRLETASARQALAQRVLEAETMGSIGQATLTLTHRLGNDLGAVHATVSLIDQELARLGVNSPTIRAKLNDIVQDVRKALDFSTGLKAELDRPTKDIDFKQEIMVQELLEETMHSYTPLPEGVTVVLEDAHQVDPVVAVRRQVIDIMNNLFVNAIQAMPQGGTVTLSARSAGAYIELQVADTGVGIPEKNRDRIFDFLFSTRGSFGFGLWSARREALANGGELRVESQRGKGTTFTLSLPRAKAPY